MMYAGRRCTRRSARAPLGGTAQHFGSPKFDRNIFMVLFSVPIFPRETYRMIIEIKVEIEKEDFEIKQKVISVEKNTGHVDSRD